MARAARLDIGQHDNTGPFQITRAEIARADNTRSHREIVGAGGSECRAQKIRLARQRLNPWRSPSTSRRPRARRRYVDGPARLVVVGERIGFASQVDGDDVRAPARRRLFCNVSGISLWPERKRADHLRRHRYGLSGVDRQFGRAR